MPVQERLEVGVEREVEQIAFPLPDRRDGPAVEIDPRAGSRAAAGADLEPARPRIEQSLEQQLDSPARLFPPGEPGRQHASVVQHQQVPGLEPLDEIRELAIGDGSGPAIEHEQPTRRSMGRRIVRNPSGGPEVLANFGSAPGWRNW